MTDIVARLRYLASPGQDGRKLSHAPDFAAAADEIERLRAFIAKVAECQDSIGREASEVLIS